MKTVYDVYKKLSKEYSEWKIELDNYDNITLEKELFYIYANEDMVSVYKKYNSFGFLDEHIHPNSLENMYNDIVYYITNKDMLLKKQKRKDKVFLALLVIIVIIFIVFWFILN